MLLEQFMNDNGFYLCTNIDMNIDMVSMLNFGFHKTISIYVKPLKDEH